MSMNPYIKEVNDGNFEQVVLRSDTPVLVDFWAAWCAPCRRLTPIVEAVARQYAGVAHVVKLNIDDNTSVAQRYRIQAIPTLILFRDGEEKERIIGVASREAISRMIKEHTRVLPDSQDRVADTRKVG
jgi:thioredoxin 1